MPALKRVNYFDGRLLTASDFQLEQDYLRDKQRLHNRLLHGAGVVDGLNVSVSLVGKSSSVSVTPGTALDPAGELLNLCAATSLRIKSTAVAALLCLRYTERPVDEVLVVTTDSTGAVQPSRIEEGCELIIVDEPPRTAPKPPRDSEGSSAGVVLARLVRTRTIWTLDPDFKVSRAR